MFPAHAASILSRGRWSPSPTITSSEPGMPARRKARTSTSRRFSFASRPTVVNRTASSDRSLRTWEMASSMPRPTPVGTTYPGTRWVAAVSTRSFMKGLGTVQASTLPAMSAKEAQSIRAASPPGSWLRGTSRERLEARPAALVSNGLMRNW